MQKVQLKSVAELRQEINAVVKPINLRLEQYRAAKAVMRPKVVDYFFTKQNESRLLEVMTLIAGHPVEAAVNAQLLAIDFSSLQGLTDTILSSGLGLKLEADFFIFPHTEGLKEDTLVFMKQFAHALNAYRTCYGMEAIYDAILQHQHVQIQPYETYLPEIEELIASYETGPEPDEELSDFLSASYTNALAIQKKVAIQHNEINAAKEDFTEMMQRGLAVICEWLNKTGGNLIKAMTEFPDNSWLGNHWCPFLVSLINPLFAGYYSYSWWVGGSVSINSNYYVTLTKELAQFSLGMQDKMEHLKLALLGEANGKVNQLIQSIQAQSGLKGIKLEQKPPLNYSRDMYGWMFYLSQLRTPNDHNHDESATLEYQFK
ncbi:hypothetical protein [Legionella maioricensis]|uniref:Coiled-coil protein n=1 Tax=Legionella maioricensis TaxID=2896528 RepID=A0A9X2CZ53_9GAMM|nr:hypothetical protein [Legionella maioricensis]MCL9682977.1 hypothetical protein [Legionella maioricensis]MCL9686325.1 hypothetical protein [Legionella maioricensis]